MAIAEREWNHNTHYHRHVLREIPKGCRRVLDVGSGDGRFARKLAARSAEVVALDFDEEQVAIARRECADLPNVTVLHGDFLVEDLELESFHAVTALASLHHAPLEPAIDRLVSLLRPGGRLVVLGVWTDNDSAKDQALNRTAGVTNRLYQWVWGRDAMEAPAKLPEMGLDEVRCRTAVLLPGRTIKRRLLWRYLLTWQKPRSHVP